MTMPFFPSNAQSTTGSTTTPSPTGATTPTAAQAAPLPLMALALGAALFLATPAQTPVAAGVSPGITPGLMSGPESGPVLSLTAATAGRATPGDSQMRLELTASAEAGDAGAQYRLAVDHFLGTHPRASDRGALYWFGHAAGQGHVPAQLLLAQMYESGWGVARDRTRAAHWYRMAAATGDSLAAGKLRILGAETPGAEIPGAETPGADIPGADGV